VNDFEIAVIVFGCSFGSALVGMVIKLRDYHRDQDSKDVVKLVMGLIATIAALVLSLLIASASGSYNLQRSEMQSYAANVILLDWLLVSYGPEAEEARGRLREHTAAVHDRVWSPNGVQHMDPDRATRFIDQLQNLSPKTDAQRSMHSYVVQLGVSLVQTRLLMFEQLGAAISWPILVVLVGWICVLFLGFGLFTRFNVIVTVALVLGALSVSGAIFLILELSAPYSGLLRISDASLLHALAKIGR